MTFPKILLLFFCSVSTYGQLLEDELSQKQIKVGLDYLYNEEWTLSEASFAPVIVKYNNHPLSHLIKAYTIQLKYMPVEQNKAQLAQYFKELNACVEKAHELLQTEKHHAEATFYLLAGHGFIGQTYHYQEERLKTANEGRKAYGYLKEGFDLVGKNPDFYFTNGLYNFYREQYPISHPEIKPLIAFFDSGNREKGLEELRKGGQEALFTQNECLYFLVTINLKYESNFKEALAISENLVAKYPNNKTYRIKYIESLVQNGEKELAKKQSLNHLKANGKMEELAKWLFLAQCEPDYKKSKELFAKASLMKPKGRYVDDYLSMSYVGLANCFYLSGDKKTASLFIKAAEKKASYSWVQKEIRTLKTKVK